MHNLEDDRIYKLTPKGALAAALLELFPLSTITETLPLAEVVMYALADSGFVVEEA